jgi:hypothetical protein
MPILLKQKVEFGFNEVKWLDGFCTKNLAYLQDSQIHPYLKLNKAFFAKIKFQGPLDVLHARLYKPTPESINDPSNTEKTDQYPLLLQVKNGWAAQKTRYLTLSTDDINTRLIGHLCLVDNDFLRLLDTPPQGLSKRDRSDSDSEGNDEDSDDTHMGEDDSLYDSKPHAKASEGQKKQRRRPDSPCDSMSSTSSDQEKELRSDPASQTSTLTFGDRPEQSCNCLEIISSLPDKASKPTKQTTTTSIVIDVTMFDSDSDTDEEYQLKHKTHKRRKKEVSPDKDIDMPDQDLTHSSDFDSFAKELFEPIELGMDSEMTEDDVYALNRILSDDTSSVSSTSTRCKDLFLGTASLPTRSYEKKSSRKKVSHYDIMQCMDIDDQIPVAKATIPVAKASIEYSDAESFDDFDMFNDDFRNKTRLKKHPSQVPRRPKNKSRHPARTYNREYSVYTVATRILNVNTQ